LKKSFFYQIHLLQRNPSDLQTTMQPCASLIETYNTSNVHQIELLKVFFLVLQVTYFLQCGQMKSVRNTLKSLQHYIQSLANKPEDQTDQMALMSKNPLENFYWLTKDHLGILVYLLTVIHSIQTGCFDKAQKFTDKALLNLQKIKLKEQILSQSSINSFTKNGCTFITNKLHYMLLENQIRCSIAMGNKSQAVKFIGDAFQICDQDSRIMHFHSSQLHCLLGIYSLSVNSKETALSQFNQCLKSTNDTDLWLYSAMGLALCQLAAFSSSPQNANLKNQLFNIIDNVIPEKIQTQNTSLTSLSHYFKALKCFLSSNYQQAQESLREAILISNSEELSNITANSFIFMGHINFLTNQFQDSFNMLTNGVDLSEKMPDISLRIYGTSLLKGLF
jgi:MAternally-affected-uncoordination protein